MCLLNYMNVKKIINQRSGRCSIFDPNIFRTWGGGWVSVSQRHTNVMAGCTDTLKRQKLGEEIDTAGELI